MAIQYKPTKPKKEKKNKAPKKPKASKAEKPMKIGSAQKVKSSKPAKTPKQPKAPKPEKVKPVATAFKGGKVKKAAELEKTNEAKKSVSLIVTLSAVVVLIVVAVLALTVFLPAVEQRGEEIKSMMISSLPKKMNYLIGEEADYAGLEVLVIKHNGESFVVRANKCEIFGFDSSKAGYRYINVRYENFETGFNIKVEEPPRPTPTLTSISMETLPKTEYAVGEWLDTTGGIIRCEYADGSVLRVDLINRNIFGWEEVTGPGTYTLTVRYKENGTLAETTYTITVTE